MNADQILLLRRACGGDTDAFARLFSEHYRSVYGVAFSTVGNWSAAQDIAQETFLLAWARRDSLRNAITFPAWIRRIATNLAKNWIRSADYRRRLISHYRATQAESMAHSEENRLDTAFRRESVWQALESLPDAQRRAIVLFYLQGESLQDIASALGISENAAKKRLQHARAKLRAHFENQWEAEMAQAGRALDIPSAKRHFLACLASGPAVPEFGATATSAGIELWWETIRQSVSLSNILTGATLMSTKHIAAALLLIAIGLMSGIYLLNTGEPASVAPQAKDVNALSFSNGDDVVADLSTTATTPIQLVDATPGSADPLVQSPAAIAAGGSDQVSTATIARDFQNDEITDPEKQLSIEGIVLDLANTPVPGASVTVATTGLEKAPRDGSREAMMLYQQTYRARLADRDCYQQTVTDSNGLFRFHGIRQPGTTLVSAAAPGFKSSVQYVYLEDSADELIRLQLSPGVTIYGRLLAPDGSPVKDGVLQLAGFVLGGSAYGGVVGLAALTDETGRFEFCLDGPGTMSVSTTSPTYGDAAFANIAVTPDQEVVLQFPSNTRVYGRVTTDDGKPIKDVVVELTGTITTRGFGPDGFSGGSSITGGSLYRVTTGEDGEFAFEQVDSGQRYSGTVLAADGTPLRGSEPLPALTPGEDCQIDYVIRPQMIVKGITYKAGSKEPFPGVSIRALAVEPDAGRTFAGSAFRMPSMTTTSENGSYVLTIPGNAGTYEITPGFEHTSSWDLKGETVELKPGQTATVDLHVPARVTRSFLLVDESGQPVEEVSISIEQRDENGSSSYGLLETTDAAGRVSFSSLQPELATCIHFSKQGYLKAQSSVFAGEPGDVFPDETIVMYKPADVIATVSGPDSELLIEQELTVIAAYGENEQITVTGRTNVDGQLILLGKVPATRIRLTILTSGNNSEYSNQFRSDYLTLAANETADLGVVTLTPSE